MASPCRDRWLALLLALAAFLLAGRLAADAGSGRAGLALRRSNVAEGVPGVESWDWHGTMPYRRRIAAPGEDGSWTASGAAGAYCPATGLITLAAPERPRGTGASCQGSGGCHRVLLHEYGHALLDDWCRSVAGPAAGQRAFLALSRQVPGCLEPVPPALAGVRDEWLASPDWEDYYGDGAGTGNLGEYLAESFAAYADRGSGTVPPVTRTFLASLEAAPVP